MRRPTGSTARIKALLLAAAVSFDCAPALAYVSDAEASAGESVGLEEVVVTARRRNESLEKVPEVITAFSAEQLEKRAIYTEADLQRSVPGLTIRETQNSNTLNYSIRGQTVDFVSSSPPGVLSYVNDVQMTAVAASSFYDLQSVQVLKGPQGTLFGRNTDGGAVLYTTAKPTTTLSGDLTARFGNYARQELEGNVNIPLIDNKFLIRLAGRFVRRDGFQRNLTTGGDTGRSDLGTDDSQSGRVSVTIRPNDQFGNESVLQFTNIGGTTAGGVLYSLYACGTPGLNTTAACLYDPTLNPALFGPYLAAHPQAYPGGIAEFLALQRSRGPWSVNFNSPSYLSSNNPSATNTTTYQINSDLTIKNIAGYNDSKTHYSADADGSPYTIFQYGPFGNTIGEYLQDKQYSDELQFQGKAFDRALDYIIGGYYSDEHVSYYLPQDFFELAPLLINPSANDESLQISKSHAIFVQSTYNLSSMTGIEGLSATAGLRYTWEKVSSQQLSRSLFAGGPILDASFNKPSWTVGLEYQATPDLLFYIAQRGSWRRGGFNAFKYPTPGVAADGGSLFLPETTKDVEIGSKYGGRVFGKPFRLNLAVYNQWVDNVQRVIYVIIKGNPTSVTASVPAAQVSGFEVESEVNPLDWVTLGAGVAYTDARFTDNQVTLFGVTTTFGPYADAPRWTGNLFAEVTLPLDPALGEVSIRGDTYQQSTSYFSSTNDTINPGTQLPSYGVTNFRLNWVHIAGSKIGAALFVTNAFNKEYYTGGLPVGSVFGLNTAVPGKPRMYGAEVRMSF